MVPEETQTLEFKRLNGRKVVGKILETIVAMSNTDGGLIIIGIDDPEKTKLNGVDRVFGIEENEELFDEVIHGASKIIPPIGAISPEIISVNNGKRIAVIKVLKSTQNLLSINNEVFIRLHKSNKKLTPAEIIKFSYAKGFEKADQELVSVDFDLIDTELFSVYKKQRGINGDSCKEILYKIGLARKDDYGVLKPTRASVLLFSDFPSELMPETKASIRVYQYQGTLENFKSVPNLVSLPKTIGGPLVKQIEEAQKYVLDKIENGIEMHKGFITKYKLPRRAVEEAITNAVIHRDYHLKRDIEITIFEDRVEILSPGLFPANITKFNIGKVRSEGDRNGLILKHLREFPSPPNLDRNEGVQAMRDTMAEKNLIPPIFLTYPLIEDSVKVYLFNEERESEWEKVSRYLEENRIIDNKTARSITGVQQIDKMSKLLKKWTLQGLLEKIDNPAPRYVKYRLSSEESI